jgi:hypothetical protein
MAFSLDYWNLLMDNSSSISYDDLAPTFLIRITTGTPILPPGNCTTANSWYNQHHLGWADGASFGYGNESINREYARLMLRDIGVGNSDNVTDAHLISEALWLV